MSEIIKKYDFIMSIGRFCHCTAMLNNHGLKLFDGPWDWSGTGRAEGIYKRLDALANGFDGWFNKKDFVKMDPEYTSELMDGAGVPAPRWERPVEIVANKVDGHITNLSAPSPTNPEIRIYNPKTLTYYAHDFHEKPSLDEQWPNFYKKYIRRCSRTLKFMQAADSILLVYMNHIADQRKDIILDDNSVIKHMERLRKKYPNKTIDLYIFDHKSSFKGGEYKRSVLDVGVIRYFSNHENVYPSKDPDLSHQADGFMIPISICSILRRIELTDKFRMI